jgi:hypothetical protein
MNDPALDVQIAYEEGGAGITFAGVTAPWTIARHSAALSLGCKPLLGVGPDVRDLMVNGTYSNALRDVIIVLWICSLTEKEVLKLNCVLSPEAEQEAIAKAFSWAEKIGLTYGTRLYLEGLALLDRLITGIWHSFFTTTGQGKPVLSKKNIFQPGKSESLTQPQSQPDTQPVM